jgi:putative membrane protein
MHDFGFGFGMFPFGWIFMLFYWGVVILGIVVLVRWLMGRPFPGGSRETPLDILKRRYANGEIDEEQFEKMKQNLED